MAVEEFSMPIDSDFVLYQGWITRNTRRRRGNSDASVPSSVSTKFISKPTPFPIRSVERRRNTVDTSNFYRYTSRMSVDVSLAQAPAQIMSPPPLYCALPDIDNQDCIYDHMSTASSLPADKCQLDTKPHMIIAPPSPPQSPLVTSLPLLKQHASSLPLPQIPLPPIPETPSSASSVDQTSSAEISQSSDVVTCLVLDNKKICLARPRLVQIKLASSA
ncbi:hypothetical protein GGH12_002334 [Coemansia sp. RSA 1822]|nr:hypothetical protein LPJ76_002032 [Coemansia sp. RSA 638]KAJ2120750.1 hypothetical protein IW147_004839 [Coemansia sp. RSA 720]KAJ2539136.1 hypothetical protein GGF49_005430 [Coemansia sp. RSA 1853]KAJ2563836.1 hypothetical protein GGH12_002334 [Coemansia sp. RSA 1822]